MQRARSNAQTVLTVSAARLPRFRGCCETSLDSPLDDASSSSSVFSPGGACAGFRAGLSFSGFAEWDAVILPRFMPDF
ncbi:hypothetical protein PI125_g16634 [Phytophthora idaei]|nr:hypothetical protein PI125_g16634 [Phytophthora idaei]